MRILQVQAKHTNVGGIIMTQEEKDLLFKDITARLPYQPMCEFTDTEDDFCKTTGKLGYSLRDFVAGKVIIKPYLRPMSSMTEEEKEEYNYMVFDYEYDDYWYPGKYIDAICVDGVDELVDWFNAHHFDYRGLIPMGLALPAPEDMYSTKTE